MEPKDQQENAPAPQPRPSQISLYLGLLGSAFMLLGQTFGVLYMWRGPARIGFALLFTVLILISAKGRKVGYFSVAILWAALAASFLL
ncbi:MAG: hypothetical protein IIB00_01990 [candidate division Zixibacteria bacterium]|nr:hypothetical protein [candidate division Zixibacteria bacterium]